MQFRDWAIDNYLDDGIESGSADKEVLLECGPIHWQRRCKIETADGKHVRGTACAEPTDPPQPKHIL